jgi:hypothetical protein
MQTGFDIIINGVCRTSRDRWEVAHAAAVYSKSRSPADLVQIRNCETQETVSVLPDGRMA